MLTESVPARYLRPILDSILQIYQSHITMKDQVFEWGWDGPGRLLQIDGPKSGRVERSGYGDFRDFREWTGSIALHEGPDGTAVMCIGNNTTASGE
jgi:hypothetical protein